MSISINGKKVSDMVSQVGRAEGSAINSAHLITELVDEVRNIGHGVNFPQDVAAAVAPDMHAVGRML